MQISDALQTGTTLDFGVRDFGIKVKVLDAPVVRTGSWLDYRVDFEGATYLVQEYWPHGVLVRGERTLIAPAQDDWADAIAKARHRFINLATALRSDDEDDAGGDCDGAPDPTGHTHPGIRHARFWTAADNRIMALFGRLPQGQTLAHWLAQGAQFSPESVMAIAAQLASALIHAHERLETTHNDIRPETVSLHKGQIQLTHFALDDRHFMRLLGTAAPFIHPPYSAPELHDSSLKQVLTPRIDIYGASGLLYRLIGGQEPPPWQGRWSPQTGAAPIIIPGGEAYPPQFVAAIARGLSADPADGFRKGTDWRRAMALPADLQIAVPVIDKGLAAVMTADVLREPAPDTPMPVDQAVVIEPEPIVEVPTFTTDPQETDRQKKNLVVIIALVIVGAAAVAGAVYATRTGTGPAEATWATPTAQASDALPAVSQPVVTPPLADVSSTATPDATASDPSYSSRAPAAVEPEKPVAPKPTPPVRKAHVKPVVIAHRVDPAVEKPHPAVAPEQLPVRTPPSTRANCGYNGC